MIYLLVRHTYVQNRCSGRTAKLFNGSMKTKYLLILLLYFPLLKLYYRPAVYFRIKNYKTFIFFMITNRLQFFPIFPYTFEI